MGMKLFVTNQTREEYVATQVARATAKFGYCKVSMRDVLRYRAILARDLRARGTAWSTLGPVLCLGTRNGREVDLFRLGFFGPGILALAAQRLETSQKSFGSRLPAVEAFGRSRTERLAPRSVIGVEINPRAARSDIWIGSFDEMPSGWTGAFGVLYSNSFDQSEDPHRTAREWRRVLREAGYLIFCFNEAQEPTLTDRVGKIGLADVASLFGGALVYYQHRGSRAGYSEAIVRA